MQQRGDHLPVWRLMLLAGLMLAVGWWFDRPEGDRTDFGYTPDPAGVREFLQELDQPLFAEAGRDAIEKARGVDTFLYRSLYKAHEARTGTPWVVGKQGIGDCVSWGWKHGVQISQALDWELGRLPDPPLEPASESIYGGSRVEARGKREGQGGYVDGSYGAAAARWCRDWGIIYREGDLADYSAKRAREWGNWGNGGKGDDGKLDAVAKQHPAQHVALVRTWDEAAAAIESGYPVVVCSMQGFQTRRDDDGFCAGPPGLRWAHCMCFVAVRYGSRPGLLCLNSWGPNACGGPKWPSDQPDGSFWVEKVTADRMLSAGDSFAVGSISGFNFRDLHHGGWLMPAPENLAEK